MNGSCKAVFLDFGGTLFSYRDMRRGTFGLVGRCLERLGVEADLRAAARAWGLASQAAFAEFVTRPYYLHRHVFQAAFRRFASELGVEPRPGDLDWCHEEQRRQVLEDFRLKEGCLETIAALRAAGLHVAIVSNIDDDYLLPMLERCGLAPLLDAWTSSEEAGSCKPDPGIYRVALHKAGVEPGDVLFLGDSREQDIAGARALGMRTVLIVEDGAPAPGAGVGHAAEPHHEIRELGALLPLVRGAGG